MTHCDRLLDALADGKPHNHLELYALGMIVHSRVADLRRRGHRIHHWTEQHPNGTRHYYQLLPPLSEPEPHHDSPPKEVVGSGSESGEHQLALIPAAGQGWRDD